MIKIECNPRNNYIIMDLLMRRLVILNVAIVRANAGLPLQAPHIPLSYLLEEKADHLAKKIKTPPKWFKSLDLEGFSCYNNVVGPSKGMIARQQKCDSLQKELDEIYIVRATSI